MKKVLFIYIATITVIAFFGVIGPSLLSAQSDTALLVFLVILLVAGFLALLAGMRLFAKLIKENSK